MPNKKTVKNISDDSMDKIHKDLKEVNEYIENPNIGIHWETLKAYAHKRTFDINPSGHIKTSKDAIRAIQNKYLEEMKTAIKSHDQMAQNDIYEKASEEILAIALVNFDYNKEADDPDLGPTVLGQLATEVATFLVVQGGKAGFQHWQMLQKLGTLNL